MYREDALVSIIMPVYNGEKYIKEAIDSTFAQVFENWELLIINDGSTDSSEEIIFSFDDERIHYFQQANKGVSAARNIGLMYMKGDYFCFLDADDVLPPTSLISRLEIFNEDDSVLFVDGRVDSYDAKLRKVTKSWNPKFKGNPLVDLLCITGKSFFGPSWMIKRVSDFNYQFNEGLTHGEDLLFYIQLAIHGGKYSFTENTVLNYREGNNSAMSNLEGLENGYYAIYDELTQMEDISFQLCNAYKRKIKNILVKSYLGKFQLYNAYKVWRR